MEECMMQTLGYYDGKYDEIDKMVVPFDDRSHYYGDGVYDATCAGNHVIFNLDEHVDRFFNTAEDRDSAYETGSKRYSE